MVAIWHAGRSTTGMPANARTAQDILAERRSVVQEQRRESDRIARAILQYQLDQLDRELAAGSAP